MAAAAARVDANWRKRPKEESSRRPSALRVQWTRSQRARGVTGPEGIVRGCGGPGV